MFCHFADVDAVEIAYSRTVYFRRADTLSLECVIEFIATYRVAGLPILVVRGSKYERGQPTKED